MQKSQFKNNPNFKFFYYDTDSIYTNKLLPKKFASNTELEKLKLEHICEKEKGMFLAPKVCGVLTDENQQIFKVKGSSTEAGYKLLNTMDLNKWENCEFTHDHRRAIFL